MSFRYRTIARVLAAALGLAFTGAVAAPPAEPLPAPATPSAGRYLVRDVTVIPVDNDEVLAHRDVLIDAGRIRSILPAAARAPAQAATVIDGRGKFLVPGFVDAHVHIATEGAIADSKDPALRGLDLGADHRYDRHVLLGLLKAGVTGAANLGGSPASDADLLWLRGEIAAGRIDGPRLYVGKRINGPRAAVAAQPGAAPVPASRPDAPTTAADGIAAVRAARQRGYDFIKPYQFLNRDTYRAVVEESRRQGLATTGHLPELGCASCADRAFAFAHPMRNIAHSEELARYARIGSGLAPADIEVLAQAVADSGASVTPTLVTLKTIVGMYVQRQVPAVPEGWLDTVDPVTRRDWTPPANRYLSPAFRAQDGADTYSAGYDFARVLTRALHRRGVALTVGTDAALPGLAFGVSVQQEMIELREIGLSPLEVLRAASVNAHRLFDPDGGSGAVREGERADLVLLDADPLADVQHIGRIAGVFAGGRWWPMAEIDRRLAEDAPFLRELEQRLRTQPQAH